MFALLLVGCFPLLDDSANDKVESGGVALDTADSSLGSDSNAPPCATDDGDCDGYTSAEGDCEDDNDGRYPGAAEACNGVDDDCDSEVDEDGGATYYTDEDGDGYGAEDPVVACDPPANAVDNGADCNDNDPAVFPGADDDTDNRVDDDCDGDVDEDAPEPGAIPEVTLAWSEAGVIVSILGSDPGWYLGMAETGAGDVGWFGETCIPGDEPYGYPDYNFDICHDLGSTGGTLDRVYSPNDLVPGTTLFSDTTSVNISFYLESQDDGRCYTWGDDPKYYDELACEEL